MAVHNFQHALEINPRSAVLRCYLGMAYHKQGDMESAQRALQVRFAPLNRTCNQNRVSCSSTVSSSFDVDARAC